MKSCLPSCVLLLLLCGTAAQANLVVEYSGPAFNGATPPPPDPFMRATFTDIGVNQVQLTLDFFAGGGAYLDEVAFNVIGDALDGTTPFQYVSGIVASGGSPSITANGINPAGSGATANGFDILFDYPSSNSGGGSLRLNAGDQSVYLINGTGSLDSTSFSATAGTGNFLSVAHIAGFTTTGPSGAVAGVAVPEASQVAQLSLSGCLMLTYAGYRRRKQRRPLDVI